MEILIYYFLLINVLTFVVFGIDKRKAKEKQFRIPEKTLLFLMLFGGSLGGLLAMKYIRHKSQKKEFKQVVYLILTLQFLLIGFILYGLKRN